MKIIKGIGTNNIFINEDDIEQHYLEFTSDMENFNMCRNLIQADIENEMLFADINICLKSIKPPLTPISYQLSYNELRKVINAYLNNLQPFLSIIERKIGKSSFEEITHSVYEKYTEYQFCYELRNVLQHKGFTIRISIENNSNIQILIDKKDLLEDMHIKLKTRELLNSYPEQIELLSEYNGFHRAQCEIFQKSYLKLYDDKAHERLIDFHTKNTDTQILCVGDYQSGVDDEGKETIKLNFLHFDKNDILENTQLFKEIQG